MWNVWRTVLEENEKLARARLAAVEVFQQQIADDAKSLKLHKLQISKKVYFPWIIYCISIDQEKVNKIIFPLRQSTN